MSTQTRFSVNRFTTLEGAPFTAVEYSRLKFGSDQAARKMGHALADAFYAKHADALLANPAVIIPSPYNHVRNAATVMTGHFVNRLNHLLVEANGSHVDYDTIRRKVSYTSDYGFLSAAKRRGLLSHDSFYLNREFYTGKTLIFVDDVRITGAHEDKLVEVLAANQIPNPTFFLYFAEYAGTNPKIEADLNFAAVKSLADYERIAAEPGHHTIVRPIKYLLGQKSQPKLRAVLKRMPRAKLNDLFYGAISEGYNCLPGYSDSFKTLTRVFEAVK